jgi:uncharacterized membrane protein YGL010W
MLSWILGGVFILMLAVNAYWYIAGRGVDAGLLLYLGPYFVLALLFFTVGWGAWVQKKPFNIVALVTFVLLALFSASSNILITWIGIPVSLILVVLLMSRWYVFD